jgi:hypothetical protein
VAKQFLLSCFLSSSASCCGTLLKIVADTDPNISVMYELPLSGLLVAFSST